jgi:hypothetical protein
MGLRRVEYIMEILHVEGSVSPLLTSWPKWEEHFKGDHDFTFLMEGVTTGFMGELYKKEVPFYEVPNYVPDYLMKKVTDGINKEIEAKRYVKVCKQDLVGVAAIGVADKDHSNFDKIRIVHDLSRPVGISTNDCSDFDKRSFAKAESAWSLMQPKWFMAKVDLTAAYRSIPASADLWSLFGLEWEGEYYMDICYPFGYKPAPPTFDRITQAIVRKMKSLGHLGCVGYLDDFFIIAPTEEKCMEAYNAIIALLIELGFLVNESKCFPPCFCLPFLGIILNTNSDDHGWCTASIAEERVKRVKALIKAYTSSNSSMTSLKALESLVGLLAFCSQVVCGMRTYLRSSYSLLAVLGRDKKKKVHELVLKDVRSDLLWCLKLIHLYNGKEVSIGAMRYVPFSFFSTDASSSWGMGGFLDGKSFSMK